MKRLLILFLLLAVALTSFTACADKPLLSEIEDEELYQYAISKNIKQYAGMTKEVYLTSVRQNVSIIEKDPNHPGFPSLVPKEDWETIRAAVEEYYEGDSPVAENKNELSDLSDEELEQYLLDKGVEIPNHTNIEQMRRYIAWLEYDPTYVPDETVSLQLVPADLLEPLRKIVVDYQAANGN